MATTTPTQVISTDTGYLYDVPGYLIIPEFLLHRFVSSKIAFGLKADSNIKWAGNKAEAEQISRKMYYGENLSNGDGTYSPDYQGQGIRTITVPISFLFDGDDILITTSNISDFYTEEAPSNGDILQWKKTSTGTEAAKYQWKPTTIPGGIVGGLEVNNRIQSKVDELEEKIVAGAPEVLDTLKEIADALDNNPDLGTLVNTNAGDLTNLKSFVNASLSDEEIGNDQDFTSKQLKRVAVTGSYYDLDDEVDLVKTYSNLDSLNDVTYTNDIGNQLGGSRVLKYKETTSIVNGSEFTSGTWIPSYVNWTELEMGDSTLTDIQNKLETEAGIKKVSFTGSYLDLIDYVDIPYGHRLGDIGDVDVPDVPTAGQVLMWTTGNNSFDSATTGLSYTYDGYWSVQDLPTLSTDDISNFALSAPETIDENMGIMYYDTEDAVWRAMNTKFYFRDVVGVDIFEDPQDGQIIQWDTETEKWKSVDPAFPLLDLNSSFASGDILRYNSETSRWEKFAYKQIVAGRLETWEDYSSRVGGATTSDWESGSIQLGEVRINNVLDQLKLQMNVILPKNIMTTDNVGEVSPTISAGDIIKYSDYVAQVGETAAEPYINGGIVINPVLDENGDQIIGQFIVDYIYPDLAFSDFIKVESPVSIRSEEPYSMYYSDTDSKWKISLTGPMLQDEYVLPKYPLEYVSGDEFLAKFEFGNGWVLSPFDRDSVKLSTGIPDDPNSTYFYTNSDNGKFIIAPSADGQTWLWAGISGAFRKIVVIDNTDPTWDQ